MTCVGYLCQSKNEYNFSTCIDTDKACDGTKHCPGNDDESLCCKFYNRRLKETQIGHEQHFALGVPWRDKNLRRTYNVHQVRVSIRLARKHSTLTRCQCKLFVILIAGVFRRGPYLTSIQ